MAPIPHSWKYLSRFVLSGVLAGLVFALWGFFFLNDSIVLFEIICTAPFLLGFCSYLLGRANLATNNAIAQVSLEQKTKELDSFFSVAIDMLCVAGVDGRFKRINPSFSRVLGYTDAYLLSTSFMELIHPDDVMATKLEIEKLAKGIPTIRFENRFRCKNGEYRILSWATSPDPQTGLLYAAARDVTEEREREKRLRLVQQQLLEAQSIAKVGSWSFNLQTQEQAWTSEHYKIFEIPEPQPLDQLYKLYRERIHPDDLPKLDRLVERARLYGESFCYDHRAVFDGGKRIKYVQGRGTVTLDAAGKPYSMAGTCRDQTAEVENEQSLRTLLASMSEGLVVHDSTGKIVQYNPAALQILGLSEEELLGRTSLNPRWQLIREDGSEFLSSEHPAMIALRTGKTVSGVIMGLRLPDEETRWIRVHAVPLEINSGRRVLVTFSDISSLVKVNAELSHSYAQLNGSEKRLNYALEATGEGLWDWDIAAGLVQHNVQWCNLLGLSDGYLVHPLSEFTQRIHPEDRSQVEERLNLCLQGKSDYNSEHRLRHEDDTYIWVMDCGKIVGRHSDGKPSRMIGSIRDITAMREAQNQLIQSSKMASLGEMSAGIAHEINNPLAIIEGTARILPKYASDPEAFSLKIQSIDKAVHRIGKIVSGLRKFSRTSTKSEFKPHNLRLLIDESVVLTEAKLKRQTTQITIDCASTTQVLGNDIEIEQVFVNLINNAVDAIKDLPERWLSIKVTESPEWVIVHVSDSGNGIPRAIAQKLFQPFFTTKTVGEGTGLGLSIVCGILEMHRGDIRLLDNLPHTCFELRFPKVLEHANVA